MVRVRKTDGLVVVGLILIVAGLPGYWAQATDVRDIAAGDHMPLPEPRIGDHLRVDLVLQLDGNETALQYPDVIDVKITGRTEGSPNGVVAVVERSYLQVAVELGPILIDQSRLVVRDHYDAEGRFVWHERESTSYTASGDPVLRVEAMRPRPIDSYTFLAQQSHVVLQHFDYPQWVSGVVSSVIQRLVLDLRGDDSPDPQAVPQGAVGEWVEWNGMTLYGGDVPDDLDPPGGRCANDASAVTRDGRRLWTPGGLALFGDAAAAMELHATEPVASVCGGYGLPWFRTDASMAVGARADFYRVDGTPLGAVQLLPGAWTRGEGAAVVIDPRPEDSASRSAWKALESASRVTLAELAEDDQALLVDVGLGDVHERARLPSGAWGPVEWMVGENAHGGHDWLLAYLDPGLRPIVLHFRSNFTTEGSVIEERGELCGKTPTVWVSRVPVDCTPVAPGHYAPERTMVRPSDFIRATKIAGATTWAVNTAVATPGNSFERSSILGGAEETIVVGGVMPALAPEGTLRAFTERLLDRSVPPFSPQREWTNDARDGTPLHQIELDTLPASDSHDLTPLGVGAVKSHRISGTNVATAGAAFVLVGALARAFVAVKAGLHFPAIAALYSRLTRANEHLTARRDMLLHVLEQNPGHTLRDISRMVGLEWGATVHHLDRLAKDGLVTFMILDGRKRWFVMGRGVDRVRAAVEGDPKLATFLGAVETRPGVTLADLKGRTPHGAIGLRRTARKMAEWGLVEARKEDGDMRYFPNEDRKADTPTVDA